MDTSQTCMIRNPVSEKEKNQEKNNEIRTSLAYLTLPILT